MKTRPAVLVCLCGVVIIILVAGLAPFQFHTANQVSQNTVNGLVFGKRGIAYASQISWESPQATGFTLETWLKTSGPVHSHLANVICLTRNSSCADFLLSQWHSIALLIAKFRDRSGTVRSRKMGIIDALTPDKWTYVVISSGPSGTKFFVDGRLRQTNPDRVVIENSHGMVVLGNDPAGIEPWEGAMAGVNVYARPLSEEVVQQRFTRWKQTGGLPAPAQSTASFVFNAPHPAAVSFDGPQPAEMYVPRSFIPPHRALLRWDIELNGAGIFDLLLNFFGFIPFGVLAYAFAAESKKARRALLWTVLAGIILSGAIELTQVFMPDRDSSSVDLLFNSLGTLAGAFLVMAYFRWKGNSRLQLMESESVTHQ